MRKITTLLILLTCYYIAYAETVDKSRLLTLLRQTEFYILAENYERAAELRDQSMAMFKSLGAGNDLNTIAELHKISHAYYEKEMFSEAVKTESLLVEVYPRAIHDNINDYALYLNDLSLYLLEDHNIDLAEKYIKKALSLIKNKNDVKIAFVYVRAAEVYKKMSPQKIDLSIKYQKKAVDLYANAYGKTNSTYLEELCFLAEYYELAEDYYNAYNTFKEVLNSWIEDNAENEGFYKEMASSIILERQKSLLLFYLATFFYRNGNYDQAIQFSLKAKEYCEKERGKSSVSYIDYLLLRAYWFKGNIHEALFYASQATSIQEEIEGANYKLQANLFNDLASIYTVMGNYEEAEKTGWRSTFFAYKDITNNFINFTSDERTAYWNQYSDLFNIWYPNYFYRAKIDDASKLYNNALFAKGILLKYDIEIEMEKEYNKYYSSNMKKSWKYVQENLKRMSGINGIAIEFLSFPLIEDPNKIIYAALTLKKNDNSPHFTYLFEEAELEKIGHDNLYGEELYDLIWGALEKYLTDVNDVYFSPAGKLYNINVEALPEIVGKNNNKNYYRVSSTEKLWYDAGIGDSYWNAIIYGGIKYDASISELIADSNLYSQKNHSFRGNVDDLDLRYGWDYLPETLIEVSEIKSAFEKNNEIPVQFYTDTLATESSFKSLDGQSCKIIHIATHGFYYSESDSIKMQKNHLGFMTNQLNQDSRSYQEDYSMTRSGLLMAGCNNILRGYKLPDNIDDGILFSKEIASMNLKNVELVTLSSCDSGLGDVVMGEGVFGLQRAFKKAGAKTILMSLWKVDDHATRILMTRFYENYLIKRMSETESLKDAQRYLRQVENGKYDKPEYWAAFILLDGIKRLVTVGREY